MRSPCVELSCRTGSLSRKIGAIVSEIRSATVPGILALVLALLPNTPPLAHGQKCCTDMPAKRARAKSNEARAKASLEKARSLLGAGKREQAIKRIRKLVWKYPKTKAAVE